AAQATLEVVAEPLPQAPVDGVVGHQLLHRQALERAQDVVQVLNLLLPRFADPLRVALGLTASRRELGSLGSLALQVPKPVFELVEPLVDLLVPMMLDLALLLLQVALDLGQVPVPPLDVDLGHDVGGEVDDLLQVLRRQVEQVAKARGDAFEVPDVGDRRGQLDVAHPLAANLRPGDLHPAALTDDALEPDPLVLAAVAFPVPGRTEDALAEQAVLLRLQGPVVDGLRLLDLAVRPGPDLIGVGQPDPQFIEVVDVQHYSFASSAVS